MVTEPQHPIFVYGTLLHGQPNRRLLDNSIRALTKAVLNNSQMHGAGRAFLYVVDGNDIVVGELIWLDPTRYYKILARLDQLEGYDEKGSSRNHYDRMERTVTTDQGTITAWVYLASGRVPLGPR